MVVLSSAVVITCEHGGNKVPVQHRASFTGVDDVLASHRGWDSGALKLAKRFAKHFNASLHFSTVTRLLVELNRSHNHSQLFSVFTARLPAAEKKRILERHWHPYRLAVEADLARLISDCGRVVHLSVHSFTPVWNGVTRRTDVGLLYDPQRHHERRLCKNWQVSLRARQSSLTVHRNAPYRGIADGFVTALRKKFSVDQYVGIELEVNQRLLQTRNAANAALIQNLQYSFQQILIQRKQTS